MSTALQQLPQMPTTPSMNFSATAANSATNDDANWAAVVERDARLVAGLVALKERLEATQIEVVAGDAMTVAARLAPGAFDIVFLDPPFESGLLAPALERMRTLLAPAGLVYAESADPIDPERARNLGLEMLRAGHAGRVRFHLLQKGGS